MTWLELLIKLDKARSDIRRFYVGPTFNTDGGPINFDDPILTDLFDAIINNLSLRDTVKFYRKAGHNESDNLE